ncbi:MAG: hypothetical protein QM627_10195, partial [Luteolibacter sp.]
GAHSTTSGYGAHSTTSGYGAHSTTSGRYAHSTTSGRYAHSTTSGYGAIACALGADSRVKSSGGPLICSYYDADDKIRVAVAYPGENGIKPDVWYVVDNKGNFVEVEDEE